MARSSSELVSRSTMEATVRMSSCVKSIWKRDLRLAMAASKSMPAISVCHCESMVRMTRSLVTSLPEKS